MADYLEYLDWRGDLTFAQSPLNEVDNYILCKLGCPDFTGIIPRDGELPLAEAVARYDEALGDMDAEEVLGPLASPYIMPVIRRLPQTKRFGSLTVCDYIDIIDTVKEEQFSALTILLPDGTRFVTFRGTGDTMVSWKEDFLMGVEDTVPAQADAVAYLLKESRKSRRALMVSGHSKGGNLAVYAAMKMPPKVQARIKAIYNNDGPGFRKDVSETEEYLRIKPVLHTIVSQHTTIGKLLYHEKDCTIVKANQSGIGAHDGFNWEVWGPEFVKCDDYSITSKAFEQAMSETMDGMGVEERRIFVENFFAVMTSTGARTLSDLTEHRMRQAAELAQGIRAIPEVRKFLMRLSSLLIQEALSNAKNAIPRPRLPFEFDRGGDALKDE
jgi:hypothetical protein